MITWLAPYIHDVGLSRSPGSWRASLDEDLKVFVQAGVKHIICLQQEHELVRLEPPETIASRVLTLSHLGISMSHEPIEDFQAPSPTQVDRILHEIRDHQRVGEKTVIHCQAGLGRAGTIAACMLVTQGMSAEGAIAMTRWLRPGAIQSESQEACILLFAKHTST